eukprot:4799940-Pleurochrysis_carterae.AAC.2
MFNRFAAKGTSPPICSAPSPRPPLVVVSYCSGRNAAALASLGVRRVSTHTYMRDIGRNVCQATCSSNLQ